MSGGSSAESDFDDSPIVVGGLGGSGTRVLAEVVSGLGVHIGDCLNHANDNRWFALLFRRESWSVAAPHGDVRTSLDLFARASLDGLQGRTNAEERALIGAAWSDWLLARTQPAEARQVRDALLGSAGLVRADHLGWGWKEPNSHVFIPEIARRFPRARFVLLVRNGLDMAFSRNQLQLRQWGPRFGLSGKPTPETALDYWIRANQRARDGLDRHLPGHWLELRFEAMVRDPRKAVGDVADLIGAEAKYSELDRLAAYVQSPTTVGRFRDRDLSVFRDDQLETLRKLGFETA
ncbi:MAG: sulfotransferase [Litorimonas sp.]